MKTLLRTAVGTAALALVAGTSGCNTPILQTDPAVEDSHWNIDSLDARVIKQFTGYKGPIEGTYWGRFSLSHLGFTGDHLTKYRKARRLTFRRHFLNNNPYNPFGPEDPSITRPNKDFGDPPPVRKFKVKNK